ncbi:MAG: NUDIX hydrolase [Pseudobutyrivibrio sp.]|nr:NUDIX hydrolase [Pseudobutyrivibrio sp.]
MERIKRINRQLVKEGNILDIYEDTMLLPNGEIEKWDFVSHRMGAACVVAVMDDGKIILVRQYRPAIERETLELPAGKRDSQTEDTVVCAKRELEEETGYTCNNIELLIRLNTTVAFCDEFIDVYLATGLKKIGEQHLDDAEDIVVIAYDIDTLLDKIYSCEIRDSKTVAGILAYITKRAK